MTLALLFDSVFIYFAVNRGTTSGEAFGSFLMTSWMLIGSVILSIPVFPYVVWKFVKDERPIFWLFGLAVASLPLFLTLVFNL